jgi:hypothetical protein
VPTEEFFVVQGNSSIAADPVAFHAVRHRRTCGSTPKFKMPRVLPQHSAAHNRAELSKIVEKLTGDRLGLERPQGYP